MVYYLFFHREEPDSSFRGRMVFISVAGGQPVFFFSCVKTKSVRETFFWPFFKFFHAQKIAFTHTFLQVFTYGENFSRTLFMIFSRMDFVFSRGEFRYFSKFSRMGFVFFTGKK